MSVESDRPVVLAYDGSDDARQAIEAAGTLLGPGPAVVLHVYQPFAELLIGEDLELPESIVAQAAVASRADRQDAEATAAEGVEIARRAGFDAVGVAVKGPMACWPSIVAVADEHDASSVVTGSRGLSGLSRVLGSVSAGVVNHCERPVLVVPPGSVGTPRAGRGKTKATAGRGS